MSVLRTWLKIENGDYRSQKYPHTNFALPDEKTMHLHLVDAGPQSSHIDVENNGHQFPR